MTGTIRGIEGLTLPRIRDLVDNGARFVTFPYCISILFITFRRTSDIYFLRPGQNRASDAALYTLISFLVGWWGFPFGPIFTIEAIYHNFRGGKNLTAEVLALLESL